MGTIERRRRERQQRTLILAGIAAGGLFLLMLVGVAILIVGRNTVVRKQGELGQSQPFRTATDEAVAVLKASLGPVDVRKVEGPLNLGKGFSPPKNAGDILLGLAIEKGLAPEEDLDRPATACVRIVFREPGQFQDSDILAWLDAAGKVITFSGNGGDKGWRKRVLEQHF